MSTYKEQYAASKKVGGTRDLTPQFVEFKEDGDEILGKYLSASDVQGSIGEGTYKQYVFDTDDGLVKFALGNATDREVFPQLVEGGVYHVEFKGKVAISKSRSVNKFKVTEIITESTAEPEAPSKGKGKEENVPF